MMENPLEMQLEEALRTADVGYSRPDRDVRDPTNLDFRLHDVAGNPYIEVKAWHSPRLAEQLEKMPSGANAIILVGQGSVTALLDLAMQLMPSMPEGVRFSTPDKGDVIEAAHVLNRIAVERGAHPLTAARIHLAAAAIALAAENRGRGLREAAMSAGEFLDDFLAELNALDKKDDDAAG